MYMVYKKSSGAVVDWVEDIDTYPADPKLGFLFLPFPFLEEDTILEGQGGNFSRVYRPRSVNTLPVTTIV
jgi:hypothetical protein